MDVIGDTLSIANGSTSTSLPNLTDFGLANTASDTVSRTFTIKNTGMSALTIDSSVIISGTHGSDFKVTTQPASSVLVSHSTTFTVEFDPSATGIRTATIRISNDDPDEDPYTFAISGIGVSPEINVLGNNTSIASGSTTTSIANHTDFGLVNTASGTALHVFTIKNVGTDTLTLGVGAVSISGTHASDFGITFQPAPSILAGDSTTFTVEFDPSATGIRTATISISNDDPDEDPYTFAISGIGVSPEINVLGNNTSIASGSTTTSIANHTDFGLADTVSGTASRIFTIINTGNGTLTLGTWAVSISGTHASDFGITFQPAPSILPTDSTTFTVKFSPSATGTRTASIRINNDDPDENPYTFAISGTGTVGIPNLESKGAWIASVFPNPGNGLVIIRFIESGTEVGAGSIELTDIRGRKLMGWTGHLQSEKQLDLLPFGPGVYLLRISSAKGIQMVRLVVE
jgi:hypothetical protein